MQVFKDSGRSVPVFNDKHLSWNWEWAKEMYDTSRSMGFPLMAGSSLPVTWRRPELELPLETAIDEALVAAHGPLDSYGFHALETLQGHGLIVRLEDRDDKRRIIIKLTDNGLAASTSTLDVKASGWSSSPRSRSAR